MVAMGCEVTLHSRLAFVLQQRKPSGSVPMNGTVHSDSEDSWSCQQKNGLSASLHVPVLRAFSYNALDTNQLPDNYPCFNYWVFSQYIQRIRSVVLVITPSDNVK